MHQFLLLLLLPLLLLLRLQERLLLLCLATCMDAQRCQQSLTSASSFCVTCLFEQNPLARKSEARQESCT